jgi:hypothetical protein
MVAPLEKSFLKVYIQFLRQSRRWRDAIPRSCKGPGSFAGALRIPA